MASAQARPIPEGFRTVTPYLVVKGADQAIAFYKRAFSATELTRCMCHKSNRVTHAKLRIGDSMVMLNDEFPEHHCLGPQDGTASPVTIHLYVEDVDALYDQAVAAGAKASMPVSDTFWGDRFAKVVDPFGHSWSLATHKEDLSAEEIEERAKHAFG